MEKNTKPLPSCTPRRAASYVPNRDRRVEKGDEGEKRKKGRDEKLVGESESEKKEREKASRK